MKKVLIFIFAMFLFSLVSAGNIETNYYIVDDKVLVEHYFEGGVSNLELRIPYDVDEIETSINYGLEDFENYKIVKVNSEENFSMKYITKSLIDKSKKEYYFTAINYFSETQKVKLVFPESAVLVEGGIIFPKVDSISSDGRRVILNWESYSEDQIIVNYESPKKNNSIFYLIIIFLLGFVAYSFINKKIPKKKGSLTKNLLEDEKKIVEFLLDKKDNEAWTKEIMKSVDLTKVKLSRKLRSLEKKELIKKVPYGNKNKIRLLKK